jgi:hypothetical protein
MPVPLTLDLIQATVQVEQPLGDGTRTVGAGFLINDPTPDGAPRVVLVTANHVFAKMPGPIATIGFRIRFVRETLTLLDHPGAVPPVRQAAAVGAEAPGMMSAMDAASAR